MSPGSRVRTPPGAIFPWEKYLAEVGFDPTTCGLWAHRADHCATLLWQPWSNGQDSGLPSQRPGFDSRRLHAILAVGGNIRHSIVVRTPGSHPGDPGSIPGGGTFWHPAELLVQKNGEGGVRTHAPEETTTCTQSGGISCTWGCRSAYDCNRMRPYSGESTPSRPIWEVKHRQAQLVLR